MGATSTRHRVTRFWWVIRPPGPDVSNARHLAAPSEAGAGLRGVCEGSWSRRRDACRCAIPRFGLLFGRRLSASLSLSCCSSSFHFPPAPPSDWPGMPAPSGWEMPQCSEGIDRNSPPGNWDMLVKFLRRRNPLLWAHRSEEEARK